MKRFLLLVLCLMTVFACFSCTEDNVPEESSQSTSQSSAGGTTDTEDKDETESIKVTANSYLADLETLNIAWDEDREPTQIQKDTFIALVKNEFKDSKITFTDEYSLELSDTSNKNHDFVASNCERIGDELYGEIEGKGKIDILIYEDKISFMCDFFSGWYLSLDYKIEK